MSQRVPPDHRAIPLSPSSGTTWNIEYELGAWLKLKIVGYILAQVCGSFQIELLRRKKNHVDHKMDLSICQKKLNFL